MRRARVHVGAGLDQHRASSSAWPCAAAHISGVWPRQLSTGVDATRRARAAPSPRRRCPVRAQVCSAVSPSGPVAFALTPALSSRSTIAGAAVLAGQGDRRDAVAVRGLDLGAGAEQPIDQRRVVVAHRPVQRRRAVRLRRRWDRPCFCSSDERRGAVAAPSPPRRAACRSARPCSARAARRRREARERDERCDDAAHRACPAVLRAASTRPEPLKPAPTYRFASVPVLSPSVSCVTPDLVEHRHQQVRHRRVIRVPQVTAALQRARARRRPPGSAAGSDRARCCCSCCCRRAAPCGRAASRRRPASFFSFVEELARTC